MADIPRLIDQLHHNHIRVRTSAKRALEQHGLSALEPLIETLHHASAEASASAAEILGHLSHPRAIEALLEALSNANESVLPAIIEALGWQRTSQAVLPLLDLMDETHPPQLLIPIVRALGRIGDIRAVEPLIALLSHRHLHLKTQIMVALVLLDDPRAIQPMIKVLQEQCDNYEGNTAWHGGTVKEFIALVRQIRTFGDMHGDVRELMAMQIAKFGNAAVEPLLTAWETASPPFRMYLAAALGEIGDARAVEALIQSATDFHADVRAFAIWGLSQIGDLRAEPIFEAALQDSDARVRQFATIGLRKISK